MTIHRIGMITCAGAFLTIAVAAQLPKAAADMKISVTTGSAGEGPSGRAGVRGLHQMEYRIENASNQISIQPQMGYLSLVSAGGPLDPISYIWEPFKWGFPNLVLQVSNTGRAPLTLTSAVFSIRKSVLDPMPIPVIRPDNFRSNALHFQLNNQGWGDLAEAEADFNLLPLLAAKPASQFNPPFAHTVKIGSVSADMNVDVSEAFAKEGVNVSRLTSPRGGRSEVPDSQTLGKFKEGGAQLVGRLRYKAATAEGRTEPRSVKFSVVVWLFNEFLVGVPRPPSYDYEAKFQVTGSNYTETVPIKRTIQPGARETFSIRLGVTKSSVHDFDLSLRSANARIDTAPIHLEMLIPRSGAEYIQGR